jgi:hypothetical protein
MIERMPDQHERETRGKHKREREEWETTPNPAIQELPLQRLDSLV